MRKLPLTVALCLAAVVSAQTTEEEMARYQQQLNRELFGTGDPTPPPPSPPPPEPTPAPAPPEPVVATTAPASAGPPAALFTSYRLVGLAPGMEEIAVKEALVAEGYVCDHPSQRAAGMMGMKVCVYPSTQMSKVVMYAVAGGRLSRLESIEQHRTAFGDEIAAQAKQSFADQFGAHARCKAKPEKSTERCEVIGHGYRISFVTELDEDDESLRVVRAFGRL